MRSRSSAGTRSTIFAVLAAPQLVEIGRPPLRVIEEHRSLRLVPRLEHQRLRELRLGVDADPNPLLAITADDAKRELQFNPRSPVLHDVSPALGDHVHSREW